MNPSKYDQNILIEDPRKQKPRAAQYHVPYRKMDPSINVELFEVVRSALYRAF